MLDLVELQVVLDPLGYEVLAVIEDDGVRDPISSYDIVPDELLRCCGRDCFVRGCFHPLGKVIDSHQDITVIIGGYWMYGSNVVYPPSRERPWR